MNITQRAVSLSRRPFASRGDNIFDLHLFSLIRKYHMVPSHIAESIFTEMTFEDCLDAVANRVVHEFYESDKSRSTINEDQAETNEQMIQMIQERFDRSVDEIQEIVQDLCQFKVETGEYNPSCPLLTCTYGYGPATNM